MFCYKVFSGYFRIDLIRIVCNYCIHSYLLITKLSKSKMQMDNALLFRQNVLRRSIQFPTQQPDAPYWRVVAVLYWLLTNLCIYPTFINHIFDGGYFPSFSPLLTSNIR